MEAKPTLKNYVVAIYWGDVEPSIALLQAYSLEGLQCSDVYIDLMEQYPAGLKVDIYPDVPDKKFNDLFKALKKREAEKKRIEATRLKEFDKLIEKEEKAGRMPIIADWQTGQLISLETQKSVLNKIVKKGRRL